jgi:hypothetical protein
MRILVKIIVTAVAGGLTYFLTGLAHQPGIWQLTMAIFVGGIVLVVQFLIDSADEASRSTQLIRKMNEAATTLAETEEVLGTDSLTRLVKATGGLDSRAELQLRFAQQQVDELTALFEGLRSGRAPHEGENPDWLLGLTDAARLSIDATSLTSFDRTGTFKGFVDEGQFWEGELGRRYLLRQLAAIERKVRIRRLFVLVDGEPEPEQLTALLQPHQEINVETRVLRRNDIPPLRRSDLADFILFDQRISYEFETAKVASDSPAPFIDVALIAGPKHVERRRTVFEELWAAGKEMKPVGEHAIARATRDET